MRGIVAEIGQQDVEKFLELQRVTYVRVDGKQLEELELANDIKAWYLWKYLLVLTLNRQLVQSDQTQAEGVEAVNNAQVIFREAAWEILIKTVNDHSEYMNLYRQYSQ